MNDTTDRSGAASAVPENEEALRRLLQEAGPRPAVPEEDLAVLRDTARTEWMRVTGGSAATRLRAHWPLGLAAAAGLLLALGAAAWWWGRSAAVPAAGAAATLDLVRGSARVAAPDGTASAAAAGEALLAGSRVETGSGPARVALRLTGGHSVRVGGATSMTVAAPDRLELTYGTLYVDSGAGASAGSVEVVTSVGTVRDIGTQFEVHVGEGEAPLLRVRVREGAVSLSNGGNHEATAGEELRLEAGGTLSRGTVPPTGELWTWTEEAAPGLDIEGLPLPAFLDWVSRETGLEIAYASDELAAEVAEVTLHGSVEGLTPRESLSVVLPGSGLAWAMRNGTLSIREPSGD